MVQVVLLSLEKEFDNCFSLFKKRFEKFNKPNFKIGWLSYQEDALRSQMALNFQFEPTMFTDEKNHDVYILKALAEDWDLIEEARFINETGCTVPELYFSHDGQLIAHRKYLMLSGMARLFIASKNENLNMPYIDDLIDREPTLEQGYVYLSFIQAASMYMAVECAEKASNKYLRRYGIKIDHEQKLQLTQDVQLGLIFNAKDDDPEKIRNQECDEMFRDPSLKELLDPEHDEMMEWTDDNYNPLMFEQEAIKHFLKIPGDLPNHDELAYNMILYKIKHGTKFETLIKKPPQPIQQVIQPEIYGAFD